MAIERRILDEIVRQLGAEAKRAELERAIDNLFWFHRSLDRMFARASMTAMIEDARQIADLIARLENKLANSSRTLLYDYLLTPPWARTDSAFPADDPLAERRAYEKALLGPLWQMRLDCERLLAQRSEEKARNWDEAFVGRSGPEFDRDQRRYIACSCSKSMARNLIAFMRFITTMTAPYWAGQRTRSRSAA